MTKKEKLSIKDNILNDMDIKRLSLEIELSFLEDDLKKQATIAIQERIEKIGTLTRELDYLFGKLDIIERIILWN